MAIEGAVPLGMPGRMVNVATRVGLNVRGEAMAGELVAHRHELRNRGRLDPWINPNQATLSDVIRDQLGRPTPGERPRLYWNVGGDMDLFVEAGGAAPGDRAHNVLFQNTGHGNHWLTIQLVGVRTNRAALGARIRVDLAGPGDAVVSRHRTVTAGSSFGGNPLACTVGLGRAEAIRTLKITWPRSGARQTFRAVPIDRSIEIIEGNADFRVLDAPPIPLP